MATQGVTLDPVQQHMLAALVLMHEENPGWCSNYPMIRDKVYNHTEGKVELSIDQLREARRSLIKSGLIADGGIGFTATEQGCDTYYRMETKHNNKTTH